MKPTRLPHPKLALALIAPTLLALLAGCATGPTHAPGSTAPPVSEAPVAPGAGGLFGSGLSDALEPQRVRLAQLLRGTPVQVEATSKRALRVSVPLKNSFEPGRAAVRPALAAVLDQIAAGFKPYAATVELRIAAPDEAKGTGRLARERAASTRDYLVAKGVPVSRIAALGTSEQESLDVVISDRPLNKP